MTLWKWALLLLLLLLDCPSALADPSRPGPFAITHWELDGLVDPARQNRLVQTRITIPNGPGPFPLILMSHGNGGNWSSHQHLVDHIASHGYVVLAPNHPCSDTQRVFKNRRTYSTGPNPGRDPSAVLGRPADIRFLIDQASGWNVDPQHRLAGKLNLDRIGAVGHSYGSYTVQAVCGARPFLDRLDPPVPPGKGPAPSQRDPRIDVGVVYSPSGPGSDWFNETSYREMACPMLCFTGEKDVQASGGLKSARDRYRAYQLMPKGDKYHLWLAHAGHNGWDDLREASAWLRRQWSRATPEADDVVHISAAMTVAFLNAYLRDDATARSLLCQRYANSLTGRVVDRVIWESK